VAISWKVVTVGGGFRPFQSRIVVLIKWAIQDLTFNRSSRLITGIAATDFDFNQAVSRNTPSGIHGAADAG
jgi:hypothetical protein